MATFLYGQTGGGNGGSAPTLTQLIYHLNEASSALNLVNDKLQDINLTDQEVADAYGMNVADIPTLRTAVTQMLTDLNAGNFAAVRNRLIAFRS